MLNEERDIVCPYCWERVGIVLDLSVPEQEYIEDCFVCCRPISIRYKVESNDSVEVEARAEGET